MKKLIGKLLLLLIPRDLLSYVVFEVKSLLGRFFAKDLYINPNKTNYVNLGSGNVYIEGMINVDFFGGKSVDYALDLRYPFRITDESVDGIVSEHSFEHLNYDEALRAFNECHRIMKPGAKIRIIVPDLSILISKYQQNDNEWFKSWKKAMLVTPERELLKNNFTKMFAVSFTASFYHHKSCWDYETLKTYLNYAGFIEVEKKKFRQGTSQLLIDTENAGRKLVSIYVEATKL